uniref:Ycf37 n=1 Tax=Helminthocladia australis TaxID=260093 RepID=A0A1G4NT97_9FLOR|nr:Hypothetical protein ycf37 [Helminthocladia australis]SCW21890.1 Hypothetical protein ycf37 [Helminthocladia australis]
MPIIYLLSLSILLSPITIILFIQTLNFYSRLKTISTLQNDEETVMSRESAEYTISSIYIHNHKWNKAIIILDNAIKLSTHLKTYHIAQHYNAIGFILQKNKYKILAQKYYYKAYNICPEYNYALNNLKDIETKI